MSRNLLSINDLDLSEILKLTTPLVENDLPSVQVKGTLAFLFEQPSLRTMSSFANAGARLGLVPIAVSAFDPLVRHQCDVLDEIRQLSLTSTAVVVRTQNPLVAEQLEDLTVPVINAGDGANEHPSQALIDFAAMRRHGLDGKRVALMGNLLDHRVHHSLVMLLQRFNIDVTLICPTGYGLPSQYLKPGTLVNEVSSPAEADELLSACDFVYLSPVQHYHTPGLTPGETFEISLSRAARVLPRSAKVLHPFPRLSELHQDIDGTTFDGYHWQTSIAPTVRRRILSLLGL